MRKAITISILFHVALLTWALGYFASSNTPKRVAKTTVPVDIMTPAQLTKIKAGKKEAKKTKKPVVVKKKKPAKKIAKKPAPKKPVKVVKKAAPKKVAKPKPKPVVKAKPKPKPKPIKVAKPKPKPVKKKVAKAKKPTPKPAPKKVARNKSEFDPENIAALLNKLPDRKGPAPKSSYKVQLEPAPRAQRQARIDPPNYGRRYGADNTMSANEIDAFKAQISQCWRPPTGGLGSRDLNVKLRIKFKQDGTLEKPPELANFSGSPFFPPSRRSCQARRLAMPAIPHAQRQIRHLAGHDPQFRSARYVWRLTSNTRFPLLLGLNY